MGQAFAAILIGPRGGLTVVDPFTYGSGVKLTSHLWVGNRFVNIVLAEVIDRPKRIAWIGDHSFYDLGDEKFLFSHGYISNKAQFQKIYDVVMGNDNRLKTPKVIKMDDINTDWFIVNKTRRVFIDLNRYVHDNTTTDNLCPHPVPLLTAVGNGFGSGDFRGEGIEDVGTWAFDEIYISKNRSDGQYSEFCALFVEDRFRLKQQVSFLDILF